MGSGFAFLTNCKVWKSWSAGLRESMLLVGPGLRMDSCRRFKRQGSIGNTARLVDRALHHPI